MKTILAILIISLFSVLTNADREGFKQRHREIIEKCEHDFSVSHHDVKKFIDDPENNPLPKNGDCFIRCTLEQKQWINEDGDIAPKKCRHAEKFQACAEKVKADNEDANDCQLALLFAQTCLNHKRSRSNKEDKEEDFMTEE